MDTRDQIIDYINTEAQKVVVATGVGTDANINTSGIITATRFIGDGSQLTGIVAIAGTGVEVRDSDSVVGSVATINSGSNIVVSTINAGIVTVTGGVGVATDGGAVGIGVTQLKFTGSGVGTVHAPVGGISTVHITSSGPAEIDDHIQVGTANTGDVLTYGGSDYQWSSPSAVLTNNSVVRGLVTGAGNTTFCLVMTDSSTIDIDASTLNTFALDEDINTRITKAGLLQELETSYLRYNRNGASNNMGMLCLGHLVAFHWVWVQQQILMFLMMVMHNHSHKLLSSETQVSILIETVF